MWPDDGAELLRNLLNYDGYLDRLEGRTSSNAHLPHATLAPTVETQNASIASFTQEYDALDYNEFGASCLLDEGQSPLAAGLSSTSSPMPFENQTLRGQEDHMYNSDNNYLSTENDYAQENLGVASSTPTPQTPTKSLGKRYSRSIYTSLTSIPLNSHTEPSMAQILASLETTPNQSIMLQADAKMYVLDDRYPERFDSVPYKDYRYKDPKDTKLLQIAACFLDEDRRGEHFWGTYTEGYAQRTLRWSEHKRR